MLSFFMREPQAALQLIPHTRTLRKAREQIKCMVADGSSTQEIRIYLSRWLQWWTKTNDTWTRSDLTQQFFEACWDKQIRAIASSYLLKATKVLAGSSARVHRVPGRWPGESGRQVVRQSPDLRRHGLRRRVARADRRGIRRGTPMVVGSSSIPRSLAMCRLRVRPATSRCRFDLPRMWRSDAIGDCGRRLQRRR